MSKLERTAGHATRKARGQIGSATSHGTRPHGC